MGKSSVYVIASTSGHYKIGYSQNPKQRLRQLMATKGPFEYSMVYGTVCSTEKEARFVERALHEYFISKRVRGEWYELDVSDLIFLGESATVLQLIYKDII